MSEQVYGVKETGEVLTAAGDIAVICFKAHKAATGADGKIDVQKLGQGIATELMLNPVALADLKAAYENISDVPKEVKDLTFTEGLQLVAIAGAVAAKAAAAVSQ